MKKNIFLLCIIFFYTTSLFGSEEIRLNLYYEETSEGWNVYVDNNEIVNVSIQFSFTLNNLKSSARNNSIVLLPPNSNRNLIANLTYIRKGAKTSINPIFNVCFGDHTQNKYNEDYSYYLPFVQGASYRVDQGYNGNFSHKGEYMIDFNIPEGTSIHAIREGLVLRVIQHNNRGCKNERCKKFGNSVIISHSDGTFAIYSHIRQNGSVANEGDKVEKGQLIAYSGNTGWSSGPHLHISVFFFRLEGMKTLKTKFLIGTGEKAEYLIESQLYKREY